MGFDRLFAPFLWISGLRSIHDTVSPFCCDAWQYLENGLTCAENIVECWHPYRPVGANMYFSIQFRMPFLTLDYRWIYVLFNVAWLAVSTGMACIAMVALLHIVKWWQKTLIALVAVAAHYVYFAPTMRVHLAGVPTGCATLLALWLFICGGSRERPRKAAVAGWLLRIDASLRSFYLCRSLIAVLMYAASVPKQSRKSASASLILVSIF